jgi:hypothetical protein
MSILSSGSPRGYKPRQIPRMSPEVMDIWRMLSEGGRQGMQSGLDFWSKLASGDQSAFEQAEAPAYSAFQQSMGNLGSRFSGQGLGGRNSSAFQNAMAGASSDLAQQLQGNRMNMQNQAIQQLMGMYGNLMGNDPYEQVLQPKKPSGWERFLEGLGGFGNVFGIFGRR